MTSQQFNFQKTLTEVLQIKVLLYNDYNLVHKIKGFIAMLL